MTRSYECRPDWRNVRGLKKGTSYRAQIIGEILAGLFGLLVFAVFIFAYVATP